MEHDLSLHSGERQVATEYSGIRADHRFRYEWANNHISEGGFGLDIFCGNGYGTWLLAQTRLVVGIDASTDAIRLAETHFRTARTLFCANYYPFDLPSNTFDFVVSLESVEHVKDGATFFQSLVNSLKPGGVVVFSTPCEDLLPHAMTGNHFHFKHYTLQETLALASSYGLELLDWAGQNTYTFQADGRQGSLLLDSEMHLSAREAGQFLVLLSRKL